MNRIDDSQKVHVEIINGKYMLIKEDGTISNGPFDEQEFFVRSIEARTIRDYSVYLDQPIPEMVKAVLKYNGDLLE